MDQDTRRTFRVLIVLPSMAIGGTERQVVELVRSLRRAEGVDVGVLLLSRHGPLLMELEQLGVEVGDLGFRAAWRAPAVFVRLVQNLRRSRPPVVYSFLSPANFMMAAATILVPSTTLVWGIRDDRIGAERRPVGRAVARLLTRCLSSRATRIIVNGDSVRESLVEAGIDQAKVRVIHNGINVDRFRPDVALRESTRRELGVERGDVVIACVARLVPKKRHHDVVTMFATVAREIPRSVLWLVGEGEISYKAMVARQIDDLGLHDRVAFLGARTDPEAVFNAADVVVLASDAEGFPNSVAEAIACGTPCIATAVGESFELLGADYLVAPGDTSAMAAAVVRVAGQVTDARVSMLPASFSVVELARRSIVELREASASAVR